MIARRLPLASRHRALDHLDRDRGAVAVEMALVLPVLLFVLMAMIDFGRGFNAQILLSQAAREGVRLASLNPIPLSGSTTPQTADPNFGDTQILNRVSNAAGSLGTFTKSCGTPTATSGPYACITYCATASDTQATVVLTSYFTWITGISGMSKLFGSGASTFPTPNTIQTTGVMRCAG